MLLPMHLMPDVETSLKIPGQLVTSALQRSWSTGPCRRGKQDSMKTWVGVAFIMQSTKLVSAKMNFMAIREIYGPRKLPAIRYVPYSDSKISTQLSSIITKFNITSQVFSLVTV